MLEYCSSKKIFTFVIALLGFSVLVFFIEEYAEETVLDSQMSMKKEFYENRQHSPSVRKEGEVRKTKAGVDYTLVDCWKHERFTVVSSCLPCKDFEVKAIKAEHCIPTGFYDRLNCEQSNVTALRPCLNPKAGRHKSFYAFTLVTVILMVVSYFSAAARKAQIDRQSYMRISQTF